MRILITGGSGFIGTNLVAHYLARGHQVLNFDIEPPRNAAHAAVWHRGDLRDRNAVRELVADMQPQAVLHMGARTDLFGRSLADYSANIEGVDHLLESLLALPSAPVAVFASSMLVCRLGYTPTSETDYCPSTVYGQSKIAGEQRVRAVPTDKLRWTIVRPTSIWGPWFASPYRDFFETVSRGLYVHPRGRRIRRNYGFVLNIVHQLDRLVAASAGPLLGRTVYVADSEPIELHSWSQMISQTLEAPAVREVPLGLLRVAARIGDGAKALGYNRAPMTSFRLQNLLTDCLLDSAPIHDLAGPDPHPLAEAVRITCRWMKDPASSA
jgi:GlcNAc-P-P-Und epimerase